MRIQLSDLGKSFSYHTIFRNLNFTLEPKVNYVILGGNGSGKSTLLKVIAGGIDPTEGKIEYSLGATSIATTELPQHLSFCSPYMDVIEEFTFAELIHFQRKFKAFRNDLSDEDIIGISRLKNIDKKAIRHFSSGMKQRVKLTLALTSETQMTLLDEPTSNLDPAGKKWYGKLIKEFGNDRSLIVASNHLQEEYPPDPIFIDITQYKR